MIDFLGTSSGFWNGDSEVACIEQRLFGHRSKKLYFQIIKKKKNSNKCLKINFDHELLSQNFNIVLNKPLYLDFVMGIRKLLEKSYPSFLTYKVKL